MLAERLCRSVVKGCIVSTVSRPDKGRFETAIIDKNDRLNQNLTRLDDISVVQAGFFLEKIMLAERLCRSVVKGCIVSTVSRPDKGRFETAIIDKNDIYIVEKFTTQRYVKDNHRRWEDAILSGEELKDTEGRPILLEPLSLEDAIYDLVNTRSLSRPLL
jgi:hypothetical protein